MEQAASLDIQIPFLGSDTLDDNMVLEATKGTNLQLFVSTFYQEGGNEEFDKGIKEYINGDNAALTANGGNDTISAVTAMGYDAYFVALEAIKAAGGPDKAAIKGAIGGVTYEGVSGSIAFDPVGDERCLLTFDKNTDGSISFFGMLCNGRLTPYKEEIADAIKQDSFFKPMIGDYATGWVYKDF